MSSERLNSNTFAPVLSLLLLFDKPWGIFAYGGPYGRKGMREFSKEDQIPFKRSKGNAFLLYVFGVKSNV